MCSVLKQQFDAVLKQTYIEFKSTFQNGSIQRQVMRYIAKGFIGNSHTDCKVPVSSDVSWILENIYKFRGCFKNLHY